MHLYPARLDSASSASVARQVPLSRTSLLRSLPPSPCVLLVRYQVPLPLFRASCSSALCRAAARSLASWTFGRRREEEEKEEGGGGGRGRRRKVEEGGGRSTFLPKETRACRALLFPTLSCSWLSVLISLRGKRSGAAVLNAF